MTDPRDVLLDQARQGIELREAKASPLWGWLIEQAKAAARKANEDLLQTDPTDWKKIAFLQGEVKRFYEMEAWMESAIKAGEIAEQQFNETYLGDVS